MEPGRTVMHPPQHIQDGPVGALLRTCLPPAAGDGSPGPACLGPARVVPECGRRSRLVRSLDPDRGQMGRSAPRASPERSIVSQVRSSSATESREDPGKDAGVLPGPGCAAPLSASSVLGRPASLAGVAAPLSIPKVVKCSRQRTEHDAEHGSLNVKMPANALVGDEQCRYQKTATD